MSETDERKSMDDVLASIRRIVRAEKEPEPAVVVSDAEERPMTDTSSTEADMPLELTPDMRMDPEPAEEGLEMADPAPAPGPAMDEDQIREIVREVVLAELAGDEAGNLVREVIKDELVNGEIGSNISQNVMALIQAEVGKALNT